MLRVFNFKNQSNSQLIKENKTLWNGDAGLKFSATLLTKLDKQFYQQMTITTS